MHRCFSPWTETVMRVLAEFLCANVILLKIMQVTISGIASDKCSTTLLGNILQAERKRKSILMNDNSPLASPL